MDCIFCKIAAGEIPAGIVYQDKDFVAFRDIHPQAPVHVVVIPRLHISNIMEAKDNQAELLGRLLLVSRKVAEIEKVAISGFRLVFNYGEDANLVVPHLHMHLLGGKKLKDPPG
jgi:histidine triad (HIT) family protein